MEGYGSASLWPQGSAPQGGFGGLTNDNFVGGFQGGLDASPQLWNQNNQPKMPPNSMQPAGFGSFVPQLRLGNTSAPPFVPMVDANKSSIASSVGNANAKRPNLAWDGILGPNGVQAQGSESSINALSTMSTLNNPSGSQVRKPGVAESTEGGPMNARQILQAAQKLENALMNGWITPEQAQEQASKFQAMLTKVNTQPVQDFGSPAVAQGLPSFDSAKVPAIPNGKRSRDSDSDLDGSDSDFSDDDDSDTNTKKAKGRGGGGRGGRGRGRGEGGRAARGSGEGRGRGRGGRDQGSW
uniref:Uncharacterized protein n=1 Tax=Hanusia phi TaxID=3032 RepID=A0A7S0E1Y6_9CRYP|mmetsp:Transcript_14155/g.32647  ORF Transcript_14155/g.32647 Transcript_14155/m.32647 type:complete len:297 (+) Transcript_14155:1-891(+)